MSKADEYFKFLKDNTSLQRWWFKFEHETLPQSRLLNYWFCRRLHECIAFVSTERPSVHSASGETCLTSPRMTVCDITKYWDVDYVHLVMRVLIGESDVIIIWTSPCIGVYLTFMIRLCFDDDSTGYFAWLSLWKWFYIWKMNTNSMNIDRI